MKTINQLKYGFMVVLLLTAAACTTLGLQPATSPSQQLGYAYGTLAAVRTSTANALKSGVITVADAQKTLVTTDGVRATLDAGEVALQNGDMTTVNGKLATATAAITQLQSFLISKGVK